MSKVKMEKENQDKIKILNDIKENSNRFTRDVILEFLDNGKVTEEDLLSIGIPKIIIENLSKKNNNLILGSIPDKIEKGYTEVYFWGLPGSGKTCAISAILSTGFKMGDLKCQEGYVNEYMNQLSEVFLSKFSLLPSMHPYDYTQYLPVELIDKNNDKHPIAFIELSGENFRAFYSKSAGLEINSELQNVNDRVISFLNSNNKKIHFFIIDVTRDPLKPDHNGITQQQYLKAMESFLYKTKILKNSTDGVYIMITKSDVLSENVSERKDLAIEHLEQNYLSFINSLKTHLQKNKLTDALNVIPFSIGEVYFNELCYFNENKSIEIIEILKEKTRKNTNNKFRKFLKKYILKK